MNNMNTTPLPATPEPRKPWEVLREAAEIMRAGSIAFLLHEEANTLEAAAAPKPPTLAEAVRAYVDVSNWGNFKALCEALARAENGA